MLGDREVCEGTVCVFCWPHYLNKIFDHLITIIKFKMSWNCRKVQYISKTFHSKADVLIICTVLWYSIPMRWMRFITDFLESNEYRKKV